MVQTCWFSINKESIPTPKKDRPPPPKEIPQINQKQCFPCPSPPLPSPPLLLRRRKSQRQGLVLGVCGDSRRDGLRREGGVHLSAASPAQPRDWVFHRRAKTYLTHTHTPGWDNNKMLQTSRTVAPTLNSCGWKIGSYSGAFAFLSNCSICSTIIPERCVCLLFPTFAEVDC